MRARRLIPTLVLAAVVFTGCSAASTGTTTTGTAVTSCNTDMASASRPCRLRSSACSTSCLLMIVVEDWANTAPTTNAAGAGRPASQVARPTVAVVSSTWPVPSPSTRWRSA